MTSALTEPPMPAGLSAEWQDWLAGNIVRGCADADLLAAMRAQGFEAAYARVAIAVVRSMTERVQQANPAALDPYAADPIRLPAQARVQAAGHEVRIAFMVQDPNIALIEGLLSVDECDELIGLSTGKLQRSEVVGNDGRLAISGVRTSRGTHFALAENPLVERLEARIAALVGEPVEHGEPLQILHYGTGGEYLPHHDYFDAAQPGVEQHLRHGGQRVATLVIYLSEVDEGGDTVFPELSLSVRAQRGGAVYFEYADRAGRLDARLLHAGAPVTRGEKWIATKWLRQGPYR